MDNVHYQIMPNCHNYQYLFCGTYRETGCCSYFDLLIQISNQNKQLNTIFIQNCLASYLVYSVQKMYVVQAYREDMRFPKPITQMWGYSGRDNNLCVRFKTFGAFSTQ
jgi:hypothetical protein